MNRRESIITLSSLGMTTLSSSVYAQENAKALIIESGSEESRFKIGQDAFLLRPKSTIALEHNGTLTQHVRLIAGGVMAVFGGGPKTIETKTFTAGIRGTGIYLQEYAHDAVYCCLCYGKASYRQHETNELLLDLDAIYHDKPVQILKTASGKIAYEDFKEPNHTDDELRYLEALCERDVPFEEYLKTREVHSPY